MKSDQSFLYIVLGDVGRSPRMCNHISEQLKNKNSKVSLFCYQNNDIPSELQNSQVNVCNFSMRVLLLIKLLPNFIYYFLRMILECVQLMYFLVKNRDKKYDFIILQNPPCFYLLWVLQIYKQFTKSKVIVDVHNYGYTLMSIKKNWVLNILKFLEFFWIRLVADLVIVVSKSMQQDLQKKWKFKNILLLYDQNNTSKFKPLTLREKDHFLSQFNEFSQDDGTVLTQLKDFETVEREDRPLILVSNSSYSIDDDFNMLYDACQQYEQDKKVDRKIILIFTGSGEYKKFWFQKFDELQSEKIHIYFKWFEYEDYPSVCSIADYGLCLHNSTSKVDLPIKILDMFACETPVIAYKYSDTLLELVKEGKNGFTFKDSQSLKQILVDIAKGKKVKFQFNNRSWGEEYQKLVYQYEKILS